MINNTYAKAYTEVLEIIKYFPKEEYSKIPLKKIEFYKNNMDKNYNFTINPEIDLDKQNISMETNAIMVNLYRDYFANEQQKLKIEHILDLNQEKEEQEKREKYNPNDIFKNREKNESSNMQMTETNSTTALIEYKKTFFEKFKTFILKILHI